LSQGHLAQEAAYLPFLMGIGAMLYSNIMKYG